MEQKAFENISFSKYSVRRVQDSVSCPMSDNENRFYMNDPPAEGTSNPAYMASIRKYVDFSLLTFLDV